MGLKTCEIIFGGVSSRTFGLIVADFGGHKDDNSSIAAVPTISDEYVPRQPKPYFYGVTRPDKQTVHADLLLSDDRIDTGRYLNRDEINRISYWLTSADTYRKLEIVQFESEPFYYKCICTGLDILFVGGNPCGFTATFTCDSPYAYRAVKVYQTATVPVDTSTAISVDASECAYEPYYPTVTIDFINGGGGFALFNAPPVYETYSFLSVPSEVSRIVIDGQHMTLTATPNSVNLYENFDFRFLYLKKMVNSINIRNYSASSGLTCSITTEIPIIVGA